METALRSLGQLRPRWGSSFTESVILSHDCCTQITAVPAERQMTERRRLSTVSKADEGLGSRQQNKKKDRNLIEKGGKHMNRQFTERKPKKPINI